MFGESAIAMTPADDVNEMSRICGEIADRLTSSSAEKDRIHAVRTAVRKPGGEVAFGWNRVLEFLRGKARRVDSWEKDLGRAHLAKLRRAARQRREQEHLDWLAVEIGRLEASGEELHGPQVDGLKHFLRLAGGADSAVALPSEAALGEQPR